MFQPLLIVFFVSVGIQIIYLALFIIALSRKNSSLATSAVPVSVVVCAHDEENNLRELLPQLLTQDYDRFELIVVNDRSNDGTYDFLREESAKDSRLKVVTVDRTPAHVNGKKFGITLGIKAAAHEWILLTDADCRPVSKNWIRTMSRQFNEPNKLVLGYSTYKRNPGFLNLFIRFETLLTTIQFFSFAILKSPYMGVGRCLAYRRSLFLDNKGFSNFLNVTGGDDDLFVNQHARGSNTAIEMSPEANVLSFPKTSLKSFFHQKVRHLAVGKRYRLKHRLLLGIFAVTWIFTWFTVFPAIVMDVDDPWVPGAIALRLILMIFVVNSFIRRTGVTFELWAVPFLDFLYSIYYLSTGLVASLTRKIRWRT